MLEVVTDYQELLRLEEPWNELIAELGETSPFESHAWTCAWWEAFGAANQLHVLVWRENDKICGLAPLMISRERRSGLSVRRLGTLYNTHVQRTSFPVHEKLREEFLRRLWQHVVSIASTWDVLELSPFHRASPVLALVENSSAHSGHSCTYWTEGQSPFLAITGSWDEYLKTLSKNRRSNFTRQFKKLSEQGAVTLELVTGGDKLEGALQEGCRIEAMGWKGGEGTAINSNPVLAAFYSSLAARSAATDGVRLYFLCMDGRRISFQYCLETNNNLYLLKPGYDTDFAPYSPSQLLLWKVLESAYTRGVREYDLLGDADDWKLVWAQKTREVVWLIIYSKTLRGRLLWLLKLKVVATVRAARQRLRRHRSDDNLDGNGRRGEGNART